MSNVSAWRDAARSCAYPFVDGTTPSALPDAWILDACLHVPAAVGDVRLAAVRQVQAGVQAEIWADEALWGTALCGPADLCVEVRSPDANVVGILFVEPGAAPAEDFTLATGRGRLCETCLFRYAPNVLNALDVAGADFAVAASLTGRIALAEGSGVRLVALDAQTVRVDAVGAPEPAAQACLAELGPPIRTINAVAPDAGGDFRLDPDLYAEPLGADSPRQVLQVSPQAHGLTFFLARGQKVTA